MNSNNKPNKIIELNVHEVTANQFTHYAPTKVTINKVDIMHSAIVTNHEIYDIAAVRHIDAFGDKELAILLNYAPDIVLFAPFSSGNHFLSPNVAIIEQLQQRSIGVEIMSLQALCRTHNFLVGEERKVACVLIFNNETL